MTRTDLVVLIDERDAAEELYERLSGISGRGADVVLRRRFRATIRQGLAPGDHRCD